MFDKNKTTPNTFHKRRNGYLLTLKRDTVTTAEKKSNFKKSHENV
jgi:hypothetical protein